MNDPRTPLPVYAGCEEMCGRLRAFVSQELLAAICDRSGHDDGDHDDGDLMAYPRLVKQRALDDLLADVPELPHDLFWILCDADAARACCRDCAREQSGEPGDE